MNDKKFTPKNPIDFTDDGTCSKCGQCCSSLLPVTQKELDDMKAAADAAGFTPILPDGDNVIYLHCPFLQKSENKKCACAVYDHRPEVCRRFLCSKSSEENTNEYLKFNPARDVPDVQNVWSVYNQTGFRVNGETVLYDKAPTAEITDNTGKTYRLRVGRPISLELTDGRVIPPSLILNVYEDAVQIFESDRNKIAIIRYSHIADILTLSAHMPMKNTSEVVKSQPNRAQRRKMEKERKKH